MAHVRQSFFPCHVYLPYSKPVQFPVHRRSSTNLMPCETKYLCTIEGIPHQLITPPTHAHKPFCFHKIKSCIVVNTEGMIEVSKHLSFRLSACPIDALTLDIALQKVAPTLNSNYKVLQHADKDTLHTATSASCVNIRVRSRCGANGLVSLFLSDLLLLKGDFLDKVHTVGLHVTCLQRESLKTKEMALLVVYAPGESDKNADKTTKRQFGDVIALTLTRPGFSYWIQYLVVLIEKKWEIKLTIAIWPDFCISIAQFYLWIVDLREVSFIFYILYMGRFIFHDWVTKCSSNGFLYAVIVTFSVFPVVSKTAKPLTYAIALNELGAETVHKYVGQEPSGRIFNAIALDYNDKPHNPLVNAGAIVINSLLSTLIKPGRSSSEKFDYAQQYFQRMAGNETVGFNNGTFLSERENADRNYSLAYYMREMKVFPEKCDLMGALDHYFQCCSLEVTCESMSVIASTLANGGICPITGDQVIQPFAVRDVLSLMHSCGMYDYSGQFAFKVGLPAKSGVAGAIMLVIPNVMGICTWSPPLDPLGNSVRGLRFCDELVRVFNFHRYDNLRHAANKKDPRKQKYESKGQKVVNLLFSASAGDVTAMRRYALAGMNMSESDYDGRTALHLAASEGHLEVVQFLLEKCNVYPEPKDRWC
ncbi:unnamed protein product, partial [Meganyctiphanes norvegica]